MADPHVEAVLHWSGAGPDDGVKRWLEARGLTVLAMQAGLLVSGPRSRLEQAFQVDLGSSPEELPLPEALRDHVASVRIPRARRFT